MKELHCQDRQKLDPWESSWEVFNSVYSTIEKKLGVDVSSLPRINPFVARIFYLIIPNSKETLPPFIGTSKCRKVRHNERVGLGAQGNFSVIVHLHFLVFTAV
jgi:hypothetical protein